MTTKEYEPEDLIKALELSGAEEVGNISTDNARDALILLGLTVKPEKPEPGTLWASPDGGFYLRVVEQPEGHDAWFIEGGRVLKSHLTPWQDLTPARVVPTEPVELTEEEVGELWDGVPSSRARWEASPWLFREHVTDVINAAIAKHGGARELPDSLQVCKAIDSGFSLAEQTDAVMALLDGGDRG